jgi:hypothetical protein
VDVNFEAPLPPPISYNQKSQPQLIRPQDIGLSNACNNNQNNNNNNNVNHNINNNVNKMKAPVGELWAHPTPPNLPLQLQAQNYNLLATNGNNNNNNKFQSPIKPIGVAGNNNNMNNMNGMNGMNSMNNMSNMSQNSYLNQTSATSTACNNNMQLFSDEFLSYLNMIN